MSQQNPIRQSLDARLSGLQPSAARRARIREAVRTCEQKGEPLMKKKLSAGLLLSILLLLILGGVALAAGLNAFDHFGRRDVRYSQIASKAAPAQTADAQLNDPLLGQVSARFDSAYYDGLTLSAAIVIEHAAWIERYPPTAAELAQMEKLGDSPFGMAALDDETRAIMQEWQAAIESGTPYGWRSVSVYPSDHVTTDDGTDIPPTSASDDLGENGEYMEMRDFESPLPAELRNLDQITLNCALYYHDTVYYFDGHNFYRSSVARQNVGTIRAVVQRDPGMLRRFTGSAELNDVPTTLTAEVSPLAAVLTLNGTGTLADLMPALAGTDADTWLELSLSDETGRTYLPRDGFGPDAALPLTFSLDGSGALPESLTARLTVLSEGTDDSAAPSVEIALTVIQ